MSKVNALYHIVFSTKHREFTLPEEYLPDVYRFIWAQIRMCGCSLYRIGGIGNHIHMLVGLAATQRLSDVMRNLKANSSGWLRNDSRFPDFAGWNKEYYAFTVSPGAKDAVIRYINSQKEHHAKYDFGHELQSFSEEGCMEYDPRDVME